MAQLSSDVTVTVGTNVTLNCTADTPGNPSDTQYRWYHEGDPLGNQGNDGRLELSLTDLCMAGSYECEPFNDAGNGTRDTVVVTVQGNFISVAS